MTLLKCTCFITICGMLISYYGCILKYLQELNSIPSCPPSETERRDLTAFRFVHDPLCSKSFLPPGKLNPKRASNEKDFKKKCSLMALSLFASEEGAVKRYKSLVKQVNNIEKTIGTHLAIGQLSEIDGLQTKQDKNGHFDMFEECGVELENKFTILRKLTEYK